MTAGKGQSERLHAQQEFSGGPAGIFGEQAKRHDIAIRLVMSEVVKGLRVDRSNLRFRHRKEISKAEINDKLASIDPSLGQVLFVKNAGIRPDGGVIEVRDKNNRYRVVLVSESKHQGNDVGKIRSGIKQGKNKDQDLMAAGNAIERAHKNVQELRNFMLHENHFPYAIFLQGSNFATETFFVETPSGRSVRIGHDDGSLNRIDRVTASSYGMEINRNYCRNAFVELDGKTQMLQAA
ncbi:MAG: hypothetical protein OXE94_06540 [Aestuariivita sp.]|nr:hypothetical protein [Aestuariivita sp.]MCY4203312.1 hypothetical protein [Aestuariivita sp.]MCY4287162.1 hypothetical protein [Aestuariivita sp.]MCY4347530.1 hypothetical protein [Aestuariivita sp.]